MSLYEFMVAYSKNAEAFSVIKVNPSCVVEDMMKVATQTLIKYKPKLTLDIYLSLKEFIDNNGEF